MSVESNSGLHWFCFTVLCEWSRKLAPPSKPIRYKTKTNRDLVTRVFPRLRPVTCVYFDFSLAPSDIFVCSNWPLWLLWFWFYDTQSKSALAHRPNNLTKRKRKNKLIVIVLFFYIIWIRLRLWNGWKRGSIQPFFLYLCLNFFIMTCVFKHNFSKKG